MSVPGGHPCGGLVRAGLYSVAHHTVSKAGAAVHTQGAGVCVQHKPALQWQGAFLLRSTGGLLLQQLPLGMSTCIHAMYQPVCASCMRQAAHVWKACVMHAWRATDSCTISVVMTGDTAVMQKQCLERLFCCSRAGRARHSQHACKTSASFACALGLRCLCNQQATGANDCNASSTVALGVCGHGHYMGYSQIREHVLLAPCGYSHQTLRFVNCHRCMQYPQSVALLVVPRAACLPGCLHLWGDPPAPPA